VSLPGAVDQDAVEATYHEGFLVIRLPKAKAHRVHLT
jgi:HSP20 family molecular chaperone IbpA